MAKELRIAMIGYGFMGRAHSNAYCKVGNFFDLDVKPVLKVACARNAENAQAFADNWGYESIETDWRKVMEREDVDAVDLSLARQHVQLDLRARHAECAVARRPAGKTESLSG